MKCPRCGKETAEEKFCSHCGKPLPADQRVEVTYRDFKVTELLDIKMPGQTSAPQESRGPEEERGNKPEAFAGDTLPRKNGKRVAATSILILLAAAAVYLLLKLLLKF
jgi:hypothetical protein